MRSYGRVRAPAVVYLIAFLIAFGLLAGCSNKSNTSDAAQEVGSIDDDKDCHSRSDYGAYLWKSPNGCARLREFTTAPAISRLPCGEQQQLTLIGMYTDNSAQAIDPVDWVSSDPSLITVDSSGLASAVCVRGHTGDVTIQGTPRDRGGYNPLIITVTNVETSSANVGGDQLRYLTIVPDYRQISCFGRVQLRAIGTYGDGSSRPVDQVEWSSSDPQAASFDANGLLNSQCQGGKFNSVVLTISKHGVQGSRPLVVAGLPMNGM